jgi:murein L,D-transpeptidase YafK
MLRFDLFTRRLFLSWAVATCCISLPSTAWAEEVWVLVDTRAQTLDLMSGEDRLLHFEAIAIGRGGASRDRKRGDESTPLGRFKVAWFNPNSRFHLFIGLDYPHREHVLRAHRQGLIDEAEYRRLQAAIRSARVPPQDTALGGQIGIHGIGAGDEELHRIANWTEGCVALTNEQIEQLRRHVRIGTTVVIR